MLSFRKTSSFIYNYRFLGITTADVLIQYLKKYSPVYPGVDWRINYVDGIHSNKLADESISSASPREYSIILLFLLTMITGLLT